MNKSISTRVHRLIESHMGLDPGTVTDASVLVDDLGMDAFDLLELVEVIEEEFDVSVEDDEIDSVDTVAELLAIPSLQGAVWLANHDGLKGPDDAGSAVEGPHQ